jgi:hypothetical protein
MGRSAGDRWGRRGRGRRTEETDRLEADLTRFGERLAVHPFSPNNSGVTQGMTADYAEALDAYELAGRRARRDAQAAMRALDEGERALDRLDARLTGVPVPERFPLCFFDPRHGRSVRKVSWAPDGGTTRLVPVCAADAVRLNEGKPPIRTGRPPVRSTGTTRDGSPSTSLAPAPATPVDAAVAVARQDADSAAKPRLRDRYTTQQFLLWGALGAFALCLAVPAALGQWWLALTGLVLVALIGSLPFMFGFVIWKTSASLWVLMRRGRLVTAHYTRTVSPEESASGNGWQHEYGYTTGQGQQMTRRRAAPNGAVQPLPRRRMWHVTGQSPEQDELHGPSYPFSLGAGLLMSLPLFLLGAAADLAVCPGLLVWALLR